ncbi:hypothetical protein [Oerskovia jenensis]|uniref:hypothetical protein n=1 Tax=Oerskovia jenensis TaxID=162169 RepID=UPI0036D89B66
MSDDHNTNPAGSAIMLAVVEVLALTAAIVLAVGPRPAAIVAGAVLLALAVSLLVLFVRAPYRRDAHRKGARR